LNTFVLVIPLRQTSETQRFSMGGAELRSCIRYALLLSSFVFTFTCTIHPAFYCFTSPFFVISSSSTGRLKRSASQPTAAELKMHPCIIVVAVDVLFSALVTISLTIVSIFSSGLVAMN
jgi:hypothetical protein